MEFRITLSHVDRGIEAQETLIVGRHPSETQEHLVTRVLAWCLLSRERLEFGPGLSTPDAPDLWARDLTGVLTTWIECGTADLDELRKVVQREHGAEVACVFSDARRRDDLAAAIAEAARKGLDRIQLILLDAELVRALAASESRRQKWTVTVVGDHLYVDAGGVVVDGPVVRR
jgi:uncharacterized protein YaeQ